MKLKPSKCDFFKLHRVFRPFNLRHGCISPRKEDSSYLGFGSSSKCHSSVTYFGISKLLQEIYALFESIVSPITALMKENTPFVWTVACKTALETIKHVISNSPVLIYPNLSIEYQFVYGCFKPHLVQCSYPAEMQLRDKW